jgi:hypothetical protein
MMLEEQAFLKQPALESVACLAAGTVRSTVDGVGMSSGLHAHPPRRVSMPPIR